MGATNVEILSAADPEQFAAMTERMRPLRRRAGVPDGVTAAEAVALHMLSVEDLERARWGDLDPPTLAAATREAARGIS